MQANRWQFLAAMAGLMVSLSASAQQTGGGFGSPGRLVISADASASLGYATYGDSNLVFFTLEPGADYFIQQNLSVGTALRIRAYSGEIGEFEYDNTAIGLNVRGGYNIPLGDRLSVWPKAGLTLQLGDEAVLPLAGVLNTDATLVLDIYAPFLFHVGSNFFVGGGPRLDLGIGDDVGVVLGLFTTVGGHF